MSLKWNMLLTLLKFINKMCNTIYHIYLLKRLPHSPSRHISRSKIDSVGMLILFRGTQICHDVHCLHDVIHYMSVPHKLFCRLPVDDLCFRGPIISATNTRWFLIKNTEITGDTSKYFNCILKNSVRLRWLYITYIFCWSCPLCLRLVILSARNVGHALLVFTNIDEYCFNGGLRQEL